MENKNELKEIAIKNCTCYYFDDMNGFLDEILILMILLQAKNYIKKCINILIYDISYKTSTAAEPLRIRFNKSYK